MSASYSRRRGDYVYDIYVYEGPPAKGRFCAQVLNMVRLESGQSVSVNHELHDEFGTTRDEACTKLEAAVEEWALALKREPVRHDSDRKR